MENKFRSTFDKIYAEEELKEKTADFLSKEIRRRKPAGRIFRQRLIGACAVFAAFLFISGLSYFTPNAYVDMDVNPSISLTLNRYGRVLEAAPYNDDGAVILRDVDVRHKSWDQAVERLLDEMILRGYLAPDGLVSVTVQAGGNDREQKMLGEIRESVDTLLDSHHSTASADVYVVTREVRDCAHDYNLSPAKYLAITQLQEVDPGASYEQCAEHSISEIKQLTEEHCGEHHEENGEHHEESGEDAEDENNTEEINDTEEVNDTKAADNGDEKHHSGKKEHHGHEKHEDSE